MDKREYSLDFIKIVGSIIIVLHHYQQITGVYFSNSINFHGDFPFGCVVELFFILSGYFMYTYIDKIKTGISFKHFYSKRFFRLFPIMLISDITYEILSIVYFNLYNAYFFNIEPSFWGTIVASLGIQAGGVFPNPCINNPTWYISVLLMCYIIFFIIVYFSNRINIAPYYLFIFMIFLGIGIQTYEINLPFLNDSVSRGYYSFFWGLLLYRIISKMKNTNLIAVFSFLVLIVCTILFHSYPEFMRDTPYILTYVYFPALIILFKSKLFIKVFNSAFIGKLGQISFNVYIWHVPLLMAMYIVIKIFDLNINLSSYFSMACFVIICFIWGTLSHFFIELPASKIIKCVSHLNGTANPR